MTAEDWIPGENCDLILAHPAEEAVPLVCWRIPSDSIGPRVRIHFENYWPDSLNVSRDEEPTRVRHLWFTLLAAEDTLCPDGGDYPFTADEVRRRVNAILLRKTDILLYTQAGIISGLYVDEHAVIDTIYQSAHTVEVNLTTRCLRDIPLSPHASIWLPEGLITPLSRWGEAVWG